MRGFVRLAGAILAMAGMATGSGARSDQSVNLPTTLEAWIYPAAKGSPTCDVPAELAELDAHPIAVLKPEYFYVASSGEVSEETAAEDLPCNGFSQHNLDEVRAAAKSVLVTVSGSGGGLSALLSTSAKRNAAASSLESFVQHYRMNGVDIDFEPNEWSPGLWSEYLQFLTELATSLNSVGDEVEADLYAWTSTPSDSTRYGAVAATGTHVVVMAYDDEYNVACAAITPFSWLRRVVKYSLSQVPKAELTIGIPAYGYSTTTCKTIGNVNDNQAYVSMARDRGFPKTASQRADDRDANSGELRWREGRTLYDLVDDVALNDKLALVEQLGVQDVSVWSLGGQAWFNGDPR